jgi:membrane associated rhomboid family serine protease
MASGGDDGVAYAAHIGGLAAGALLFFLLRPRDVELFECVEEVTPP